MTLKARAEKGAESSGARSTGSPSEPSLFGTKP